MPIVWLQHARSMLFYQSYSASHNIYRAKFCETAFLCSDFCATAFLCPTVGDLIFGRAHYIESRGYTTKETGDEIMHNVMSLFWDRDVVLL